MKMFFRMGERPMFWIVAFASIFAIMTIKGDRSVTAGTVQAAATNPLLEAWTGPYGGVPPFDKVKIADFKPAMTAAMAEQLAEIDAIAKSKEPPTFENTIAAMERSGKALDRVSTVYDIWTSNLNSKELEPIETEIEPLRAAHGDKITQNADLFKRIEAVYNTESKKKNNGERGRLAWLYYTNFVRSGAKLAPDQKARLAEINQKLAGLFTKFSQNLLGDEGELFVEITNEADLAACRNRCVIQRPRRPLAKAKKVHGLFATPDRLSIRF